MGDNFDGCECVWSHEFAMQRLLAFIRQNQDACSDTDCIDVTGHMQRAIGSATSGDDTTNYLFMTMLMMLALVMYMVRPESLIRLTSKKRGSQKNNFGNDDSQPPPPPAPPAVN